jgi:hypothetical protein
MDGSKASSSVNHVPLGAIIAAQEKRPVVFGLKARNVTARAAGPGNASN